MSLQPVKTAAQAIRVVISKAFEYFTGGFSVSLTGYAGVTLPEGSLVRVDEAARTTTLIRTGVLKEKAPATTRLHIADDGAYPLLFAVGNKVCVSGGATASTIRTVKSTTASGMVITVATAINRGTAGTVIFETVSHGLGASLAVKTVANAVVAHDTEIGGSLTALRRGTAYKNRLQPHITGHLADLPSTILLSNSK
jgi:hypothetical protein